MIALRRSAPLAFLSLALGCGANPPAPPPAPSASPPAATTSAPTASASAPPPAPWKPPETDGAPPSTDVLEAQCAPIVEVLKGVHIKSADDADKALDEMEKRPPPIPPEQFAWCMTHIRRIVAEGRRNGPRNAMSAEARNNLGQIAKDMMVAFERTKKLCASAKPVPAKLEAVNGKKYMSRADEWNKDAGWSCLKFNFEDPQSYQYEVKVDGNKGFVAYARRVDGDAVEELSLAGTVAGGTLSIAPQIAERRVTK